MAGMATIPSNVRIYPNLQPGTYVAWEYLNAQYMTLQTTTSTTTNLINFVPNFASQTTTMAYQNILDTKAWIFSNTTSNVLITDAQLTFLNTRIEETQEERLAREVRHTRWVQRQEALGRRRMRTRDKANALAENLLLACLSPEQARDHLEKGWFDVESSHGRTFRIFTKTSAWGDRNPGQSGNVALLTADGRQEARYCVHPPDNLPHADAWLAQKLALEADEDTVMAVANLPWYRPGHQDIRQAARERMRLIRSAA